MNVKIEEANSGKIVDAIIRMTTGNTLPGVTEGWRFNFRKHANSKDTYTYALVTKETKNIIEGCLIYKMKNSEEPYMAFVEVAPHNRGDSKKYELVAGCLIAYACRLSFILGKEYFKGWRAFDVLEEDPKDKIKLMALYSVKYRARRIDETTSMIISPEDGEKLIEKYLG